MAGLYFEELHVGQVFRHAVSRTITESDNVWFSAITHNPALLHLDEEYCREHTEFGQRIVNSAFTLGLMVGISVGDTTLGTAIATVPRGTEVHVTGYRGQAAHVDINGKTGYLASGYLTSK